MKASGAVSKAEKASLGEIYGNYKRVLYISTIRRVNVKHKLIFSMVGGEI